MLAELTVKEFLDKVAGSDPVPGGGSVAALNGAVASAADCNGGRTYHREERIRRT